MVYVRAMENVVLHDMVKYLNALYVPNNHGSNKDNSTANSPQH